MTSDENLDLRNEMKNTRNSKYVGTYKPLRFLFYLKENRWFNANTMVTTYYGGYSTYGKASTTTIKQRTESEGPCITPVVYNLKVDCDRMQMLNSKIITKTS